MAPGISAADSPMPQAPVQLPDGEWTPATGMPECPLAPPVLQSTAVIVLTIVRLHSPQHAPAPLQGRHRHSSSLLPLARASKDYQT